MKYIKLSEIKEFMAKKLPVIYDKIEYQYITACIMRLKNNEWIYQLEMLDSTGRSITIARMEEVEIKE